MADPKIQPAKPAKPTLDNASHQRTPNKTQPHIDRTASGNFNNSDKDYSKWSELSPGDVNKMHSRSDVDRSWLAQHHTLGIKRGQASPGDHIHDGTESRPIGNGLGYVLTGSKAGNVALANLIDMLSGYFDFTDTTT